MQDKRRIFEAVVLGLGVILIGSYFFAFEEKAPLNSQSLSTETLNSNTVSEFDVAKESSLTPLNTKAVLENAAQIYTASEAYSQCEVENAEVWDQLEIVKNAINSELQNLNDNRHLRDAVFLLQEEGHFRTYDALLNLYRLHLNNESQFFQRAPYRPSQDEIDQFTNAGYLLRDIFDASTRHDIEQTLEATNFYRQNESKKGYVFRSRKQKSLWSPDTIVGHIVATAPLAFVDDIAARYPVNPLLFNQAVRSGASNEVLEKLLASFDFDNSPVYTKHDNLQTALQAAIEIESLDAIRFILAQPNLQHTEFYFNPLNTIVFNALNTEEGVFTDAQKAMMAFLVEYGFRVDIVSGPFGKTRMLAGYAAMLEQPIVDQLNALSIPPRYVEKLRMLPDSALPLQLQDQLKRDAFQSLLLKDEYNERAKTCTELKQAYRALVPPLTNIDDIFDYVSDEKSFVENVQLLKQQSLTLVDAYYTKMVREPSDTQRIDEIAASTPSLKTIPFEVRTQIDQLTPFERHHLTEVYCEKFGKHFMEDIFDAVQFMSFSLFSFEVCLAGTPDDYTDTELNFYLRDNTYPGIVYSQMERYAFNTVLDTLTDPAFQRTKDLQGYPHGRDALMLALDLKLASHRVDKKDYKNLIIELISRTELKDEHFKRLHRLKVDHFVFFEEVATYHPQINNAVEYPLVIYKTYY